MTISKILHEILSAEDTEFPELLRMGGLDPAKDLTGCDFSNVDFGALKSAKIDLSRCDLTGADLRRVQGIIKLHGAILIGTKLPDHVVGRPIKVQTAIRAKFSLLKQLLLSAHRFYLPSRVANEVVKFLDGRTPIITCYRSNTEQKIVADDIRIGLVQYMDELSSNLFDKRVKEIHLTVNEIDSSATPSRITHEVASDVDALFLRSLANAELKPIYYKTVRTEFVSSIVDHFKYNKLYASVELQEASVYGLSAENVQRGRQILANKIAYRSRQGVGILFLNGTSVSSTATLETIRRSSQGIRTVWLIPSQIFFEDLPRLMETGVIGKCVLIKPDDLVYAADAESFIRRFEAYERHGLILTEETREEIRRCKNKHVSHLKNMFISKIMDVAATRNHENGSVII